MTPEQRLEATKQEADKLLAHEISMLANDAQKAVRERLNFPTSARFEHPRGSSWALGDHEQIVYEPGRYGVRGKVFAKNAFGVERSHTYDVIFVVTDGDFKNATMESVKVD
jgi:hypothetical protein